MKTKNILIPTDLSLASLNAITGLLHQQPNEKFNISLVHFLQLSDSISELLMLGRRSREYQYISTEFDAALVQFRKEYADQILSIHTEFFYGSTVAVFKNYLEGKSTDMIVMLDGHEYAKITPNSIEPTLLVQRSGCKLLVTKPGMRQQLRPTTAFEATAAAAKRVLSSKLEHQLL